MIAACRPRVHQALRLSSWLLFTTLATEAGGPHGALALAGGVGGGFGERGRQIGACVPHFAICGMSASNVRDRLGMQRLVEHLAARHVLGALSRRQLTAPSHAARAIRRRDPRATEACR